MQFRRLFAAAVLLAALAWTVNASAQGSPFLRIPERDRTILYRVANEYGLSRDARRLLFAIRLVENGGAGRELGALTPAAMRFKGNHEQSLQCQARWAAGTIRKRFNGDLRLSGSVTALRRRTR
jgi:hypothetical protein